MFRTRTLVAAPLFVFALTGLLSAQEEDAADSTPLKVVAPTEASHLQEVEAIRQRMLRGKANLRVIDQPLEKVVRILSDQWGVPIHIHHRRLEEVALSSDIPVTIDLQDVSPDTLLRTILRELELGYEIDPPGLLITTATPRRRRSEPRIMLTVVYPVADLIDDVFSNEKGLKSVITTTVLPESWEELGGQGSIVAGEGTLTVANDHQIQATVGQLLETMRKVRNLPADRYDVTPQFVNPLAERYQEIRQQMRSTRVTLNVQDRPLEEVIPFFAQAGRFPIRIDSRSLEEVALSDDIPVSVKLSNFPLDAALDVMLEQLDLCWLIDNDLLLITTNETRESTLQTRVYPVRDLVWHGLNVTDPQTRLLFRKRAGVGWIQGNFQPGGMSGGGFGGNGQFPAAGWSSLQLKDPILSADLPVVPHYEPLLDALTHAIAPDSWEELGGPGSVDVYGDGDCLVVSQTAEVHEQIEQLLAQMRAKQNPNQAAQLLQKFKEAQVEEVTWTYPAKLPEKLKARIEAQFAPDSWDETQHFIDTLEKHLVIRHRREVQREIYRYLVDQGEVSPPAKYFPTWKSDSGSIRGDHMPGGNF